MSEAIPTSVFIIAYPSDMYNIIKTVPFWSWKFIKITHKIIWIMKRGMHTDQYLSLRKPSWKYTQTTFSWVYKMTATSEHVAQLHSALSWPQDYHPRLQRTLLISQHLFKSTKNTSHVLFWTHAGTEWQYCWQRWVIFGSNTSRRVATSVGFEASNTRDGTRVQALCLRDSMLWQFKGRCAIRMHLLFLF